MQKVACLPQSCITLSSSKSVTDSTSNSTAISGCCPLWLAIPTVIGSKESQHNTYSAGLLDPFAVPYVLLSLMISRAHDKLAAGNIGPPSLAPPQSRLFADADPRSHSGQGDYNQPSRGGSSSPQQGMQADSRPESLAPTHTENAFFVSQVLPALAQLCKPTVLQHCI